jgi:hypothetical protein
VLVSKRSAPRKLSSRGRSAKRAAAQAPAAAKGRLLAVRWTGKTPDRVYRALDAFGRVEAIPAHRLLLLHPARGLDRDALDRHLASLHSRGLIEFATPVLRDPDSQLCQIVTDEITVRFRSPTLPRRFLDELSRRCGVRVARRNEFVPNQVVLKVDEPLGRQPLKIAADIDAADEVEFAAPNFISQIKRTRRQKTEE